jgi:hypothetical protein
MNKTDVASNLVNADKALKLARANRRKADTELARAEATHSKMVEAELAAEASYKAARSAVLKQYGEHNRG